MSRYSEPICNTCAIGDVESAQLQLERGARTNSSRLFDVRLRDRLLDLKETLGEAGVSGTPSLPSFPGKFSTYKESFETTRCPLQLIMVGKR
jgi:hypothetical protein